MKHALVTGATSGIGLEIARSLAEQGFKVFVTGRSKESLEAAMTSLSGVTRQVVPVMMDVSSTSSIQTAFTKVTEITQQLDVLINNAGVLIEKFKPLLDFTPEVVHETFNVNALAPFFVTQTFLPLIPPGGRVINMSSNAASITHGVHEFAPLYSASKTAENALTLHLVKPLQQRGIAINLVCPGRVKTRMGGEDAPRTLKQGADTPVWLATEASIEITGKFFRDREEMPF
jgi:NAD(P)-dependent dehydrogenase (short-subunit alcohol dehydrogenase family)